MRPKSSRAVTPGVPKLPGQPGAILEFLDEFIRESRVPAPLVTVTLVSGEIFYFYGLRIDPSSIVTGSIMLRWFSPPSVHALVVDQSQIARVEFEMVPLGPPPSTTPPLGFRSP